MNRGKVVKVMKDQENCHDIYVLQFAHAKKGLSNNSNEYAIPQEFCGVIFTESKSSKIHQSKTNGEGSKNSNHKQIDIFNFICFVNSIPDF